MSINHIQARINKGARYFLNTDRGSLIVKYEV